MRHHQEEEVIQFLTEIFLLTGVAAAVPRVLWDQYHPYYGVGKKNPGMDHPTLLSLAARILSVAVASGDHLYFYWHISEARICVFEHIAGNAESLIRRYLFIKPNVRVSAARYRAEFPESQDRQANGQVHPIDVQRTSVDKRPKTIAFAR